MNSIQQIILYHIISNHTIPYHNMHIISYAFIDSQLADWCIVNSSLPTCRWNNVALPFIYRGGLKFLQTSAVVQKYSVDYICRHISMEWKCGVRFKNTRTCSDLPYVVNASKNNLNRAFHFLTLIYIHCLVPLKDWKRFMYWEKEYSTERCSIV